MCSSTITLLDYGAGNLTSVRLAFGRIGASVEVASAADGVAAAGPIVFPGVGSAASGMAGIISRGFDRVLRQAMADSRPILGICLGMQMLFERSAEDGGTAGLGLIGGHCELFDFTGREAERLKVPEMGWNAVDYPQGGATVHHCFSGIPAGTPFYFVHSYYATGVEKENTAGITEYGGVHFTSAAQKGALFATQFHPERSGDAGLQLLKNFMTWGA